MVTGAEVHRIRIEEGLFRLLRSAGNRFRETRDARADSFSPQGCGGEGTDFDGDENARVDVDQERWLRVRRNKPRLRACAHGLTSWHPGPWLELMATAARCSSSSWRRLLAYGRWRISAAMPRDSSAAAGRRGGRSFAPIDGRRSIVPSTGTSSMPSAYAIDANRCSAQSRSISLCCRPLRTAWGRMWKLRNIHTRYTRWRNEGIT